MARQEQGSGEMDEPMIEGDPLSPTYQVSERALPSVGRQAMPSQSSGRCP